jgi:hypothetical protein
MAGEHSPVPNKVVGGEAEVLQLEVTVTDLSSREDTSDQSRMTLVIRMKRVGPLTHMNLREAMILGPRP